MVSDALRARVIAATGAGGLQGPAVRTGSAEHPVCGDRLEVHVRLRDDRIAELGWLASACPATVAVAATAASALRDAAVADAPKVLRQSLAALGDLQPAERHAEALFLRALQRATAQEP